MEFPVDYPEVTTAPDGLLSALGLTNDEVKYIGQTQFDYFLELADENLLKEIFPDFRKLEKVKTRGIVLTTTDSHSDYDFQSRFFAPAAGVNEDPATGSAHCALGPYWRERLEKRTLIGYQISPRGAQIKVDVGENRVRLKGQAVTIFEGKIDYQRIN